MSEKNFHSHSPPAVPAVEFDAYAAGGYTAGMEDSFKRLMGASSFIFSKRKARCLKNNFPPDDWNNPSTRLLDFGCGTGEFLQALQEEGFLGRLEGCDISQEMIAQARQRAFAGTSPHLQVVDPGRTLYQDHSFDVITIVCVLHHVMPEERNALMCDLVRMLKPGGTIYIFEHNPLNPFTQYIVRRCPIDRNAELLSSRNAKNLLTEAGLSVTLSSHFLFFPPRFEKLWIWEKAFSHLPLGGQYIAAAKQQRQA